MDSVSLRHFSSILWLSILLPLGACSATHQARDVSPGDTPRSSRPKSSEEQAVIDALWSYHEAAIVDVLRGVESGEFHYNGDGGRAFDKALVFFEGVTGIPSSTGTTSRRPITPELANDLRLWRRWYRKHRRALRFDLECCDLRIATAESPRG